MHIHKYYNETLVLFHIRISDDFADLFCTYTSGHIDRNNKIHQSYPVNLKQYLISYRDDRWQASMSVISYIIN